MEEARRKLRICLLFVVMAAVIVGCIYYFEELEKQTHISEGTLVMVQGQEQV